jgi:hypothetical protein
MADSKHLLKSLYDSLGATHDMLRHIKLRCTKGRELENMVEIDMGIEWTMKRIKAFTQQLELEENENSIC